MRLLHAIRDASPISVPVVVTVNRDAFSYVQIVGLLRRGIDVRPLFFGPVSRGVADELTHSQTSRAREASRFLLQRLAAFLDTDTACLLLPALALGVSRTSVERVTAACPMPPRSVRARMRALGLPSVGTVLGHLTGFGVAYAAEAFFMTLRRASHELGFDTEESLRRHLKAWTGKSPTFWAQLGVSAALKHVSTSIWSRGFSFRPEGEGHPELNPGSRLSRLNDVAICKLGLRASNPRF